MGKIDFITYTYGSLQNNKKGWYVLKTKERRTSKKIRKKKKEEVSETCKDRTCGLLCLGASIDN